MPADQAAVAAQPTSPRSGVVVSGIRSTGHMHLGNYFGAIRNYVRMQEGQRCYFFIADYHALTTHPDPAALRSATLRVAAELLAAGLDPKKAVIFRQSDVPQIPELYFLLSTLAYKGELEKVPTFKDKVRQQPQNVNAGLLTYPVLMAADILIHRAHAVPVGKDQEQHLELARTFAHRFNTRYGVNVFPQPQPFNFGEDLVKVPSLDGQGKMSKSEHGASTIYLSDTDDAIRKKVMKAVTDAGPGGEGIPLSEPAQNLVQLLTLTAGEGAANPFRQSWAGGSIRYGDLKKTLSEAIIAAVAPMRETAESLLADEAGLGEILAAGGETARVSAAATQLEVRRAVGL